MTFKIDFEDGDVVRWRKTADGVEPTCDPDYHPTIYVTAPADALADLRARLFRDPKVLDTAMERKYHDLHADEPEPALRIDVDRIDDVRPLAREVRGLHEPDGHAPGTFRLYDVDLSPQFRYCLDEGIDPMPGEGIDLSTLGIGIGEKPLADGDVSALRVGSDRAGGTAAEALETLSRRLDHENPDVLVLDYGALVPLLFDAAEETGTEDFRLGRRPGYRTLAGPNTFVSYGQVGFSPARYDVPGRAIVDTSNSFLWAKTRLDGILYFVGAAGRPLQEVAWGSIGTILTAMQIRKAREWDVLAPWNKWEPEAFKSLETLQAADKGGFTFEPDVGLHEDVSEVDFASLYPNIMIEENISPETVNCACHPDREDVPELGYGICPAEKEEDKGFVPRVLKPMVDYRADAKRKLETATGERRGRLENEIEAIKWILVSCFGYQGYRNAKFGRIEAHEAINAVAREHMMRTKRIVEGRGWDVVHGIVDSIWLRRVRDDAVPIEHVAAEVSEAIGIRLEHEHEFEWICFVPRHGERSGALNRYFGKLAGRAGSDADDYKIRGIECRQHSTPRFVAEVQLDLIRTLDACREPAPVCDRLGRHLRRLRAGDVPAEDLIVLKRATKAAEDYDRDTHVAGALRRGKREGVAYRPGQGVRYVVVDDGARRPADGVRLHFENPEGYDADYYERLLVRAAESVVSPLGWDRGDVRAHLREGGDANLAAYR